MCSGHPENHSQKLAPAASTVSGTVLGECEGSGLGADVGAFTVPR